MSTGISPFDFFPVFAIDCQGHTCICLPPPPTTTPPPPPPGFVMWLYEYQVIETACDRNGQCSNFQIGGGTHYNTPGGGTDGGDFMNPVIILPWMVSISVYVVSSGSSLNSTVNFPDITAAGTDDFSIQQAINQAKAQALNYP